MKPKTTKTNVWLNIVYCNKPCIYWFSLVSFSVFIILCLEELKVLDPYFPVNWMFLVSHFCCHLYYDLDPACPSEATSMQSQGFRKVTGSWGHYAHQGINPCMSSQLNMPLENGASLEVAPWGCDLEVYTPPWLLPFSLLPGCHGSSTLLHGVIYHAAIVRCQPTINWSLQNLSYFSGVP